MFSWDCETTGVDLRHGCKPYYVTYTDESGTKFLEWGVNPIDRQPIIPDEDIDFLKGLINNEVTRVGHNARFDVLCLESIGVTNLESFPWLSLRDTLLAGHLVNSGSPLNLTDQVMLYLGVDISPYEDKLEKACKSARDYCRRHLPKWRIAKKGLPEMPSAGEEDWKADGWLLRALAYHHWETQEREDFNPDKEYPHEYYTLLSDYANADSYYTLQLWGALWGEIQRRGLEAVYYERLKILPILYRMERDGLTLSSSEVSRVLEEFSEEEDRCTKVCINIAKSYNHDLVMPAGSSVNQSLKELVFDKMGLEGRPGKKAKTDVPSLDKDALDRYSRSCTGKPLMFVNSLLKKRHAAKMIGDISTYNRFWHEEGCVHRLHPNINPTGTTTLRCSCRNPNLQNIKKKGDGGESVKSLFRPGPDREFWSLDGKNLELRIPSFFAPEPELVEVFNHPDQGPYYGSYHLVVFDALYPELFHKHGKNCKDLYEATYYQWVKNGNFAIIYGAQEETADSTYRVRGAYQRVRDRFPNIARLSDQIITLANKQGYVSTIPDIEVDPERGYPLMCSRSDYGRISPTIPLNYFVQGTACWWKLRALVKVDELLRQWREDDGFSGFINLELHDEVILDFPKVGDPRVDPDNSNLWRIKKIQEAMESCGTAIGIPTPTSIEYHPDTWAVGINF